MSEFGWPFVQATYLLEGYGPLGFRAHEQISALKVFVTADLFHLPSTLAVAEMLSGGNQQHRQVWYDHTLRCLTLPIEYFRRRFDVGGILSPQVNAF